MSDYKSAENNYSTYEYNIENMLRKPNDQIDFLRDPDIMYIFGVSVDFGIKYVKSIIEDFPEFATEIKNGKYDDLFSLFYSIGNPEFFYSESLAKIINPNTLRYIYHSLVIRRYMKEKFPNTKLQVVEIGGGYGGLCFWLTKLAPECIERYEICDLEVPNRLQKRCLDHWSVPFSFFSDPLQWKKAECPTFCISNYGFSEFNKKYQDLYTEAILRKVEGGFMIWNNWTGIYKFTENPMKKEDERPSFTGCYNLFLYF